LRETHTTHDTSRSIRQTQILDLAADHPEASIEWIAEQVLAATPDYVESVLETYGDPAAEETPAVPVTGSSDSTVNEANPEIEADGSAAQLTVISDGGTSEADSKPADGDITTDLEESDSPPDADHTPETKTVTNVGPSSDDEIDTATDDQSADPKSETEQSGDTDGGSLPAPDDLTETQMKTLTAIQAHPDATQRELGEILGVSAPSINNRVNTIPGFKWADRYAFVEAVFESASSDEAAAADKSVNEPSTRATDGKRTDEAGGNDAAADGHGATTTAPEPSTATSDSVVSGDSDRLPPQQQRRLEEVLDQLETLSEQLETTPLTASSETDVEPEESEFDRQLAHKVIHACVNAEHISEDEELEIIRQLV
jgi:hypothetical protein